jgi:hypothetical protein
VGPLKDPYLYRDGEEYLFLLTACARDLDRFRQSCFKLLEHVIDRRQTDAFKVEGKSKLRDEGERISIEKEGSFKLDDNDLTFP